MVLTERPRRRDLQHRRRHRADQHGAHPAAARRDGQGLVVRRPGRRPPRPRPALLGRHLQDPLGARLRAAGPVRAGSRRRRAVVPRQPRLVGAAEGPRRPGQLMTRYLIAGAAGMLGPDLQKALAGRDVTALTRAELDVTDRDAVVAAVAGHDVVINAVGVHEGRRRRDARGRGLRHQRDRHREPAPRPRRSTARKFVHDLDRLRLRRPRHRAVRRRPAARPDQRVRPHEGGRRGAGARRASGRHLHRAHRLALRSGAAPTSPRRCCGWPPRTRRVTVVDDQVGQPTWTGDLAAQIVALLDSDAPAGIYHGTNAGRASWFEFARAVFGQAGLNPDRVTPTDSSAFVRPAPRPSFSVLGHEAWRAAGLEPMRAWEEALADAAGHGVLEQHDNPASGR